jgi:hypothetical protein
MSINKLDLLAKGWNTAEIEHASRIIEEAEKEKIGKTKFVDTLRIAVLILLMIANGVICSKLLVPFIFAISNQFILVLAAVIGFIFSTLFGIIIYDYERIHHKYETSLFVLFIVSGIANYYLILEFAAQFSIKTKLPVVQNVYIVAGTYLIAFLIPQVVYRLRKKSEI